MRAPFNASLTLKETIDNIITSKANPSAKLFSGQYRHPKGKQTITEGTFLEDDIDKIDDISHN